jgi:hypothetical protein
MSSTKTRETRIVRKYRFDPARDSADIPDKFELKTDIMTQVRDGRVAGGWTTEHTEYGTVLTPEPLTRRQLADLIADGADWLSYLGDE